MTPLDHIRRLMALAQSGLHFTKDPYDRERYEEVARIAAQLLAGDLHGSSDADKDRTVAKILELWRSDTGYVTPKLDVRAAIYRHHRGRDEVLLVRETVDGKWTMPGGWADVNEGPRLAVEKEVEQESGYIARAVKLAALYDKHQHGHPRTLFHAWKAFFICDIVGGEPKTSIETDGVEFFPLDALPELSIGRTTVAQIQRIHRHHVDRALPAEFD